MLRAGAATIPLPARTRIGAQLASGALATNQNGETMRNYTPNLVILWRPS